MATVTQIGPRLGIAPTCAALGLPRATYYRRRRSLRAAPPRRPPPRALNPGERAAVLAVLHEPRFVDLAPAEVYATLLDAGQYLCSERTMYRVLAAHQEVRERRQQLRHPRYAAPELLARWPNELWSWDITKLLGPAKWTYFYLYVMLDVFSRYVVGWMVAHRESATLAEQFIHETCARQGIGRDQLTIHADRGEAMTSKSVAFLLADLGVTKTHSRPHVSNDNPFSEAQFKTLKYRPAFPDRFGARSKTPGPTDTSSSPGTTRNTATAASGCSRRTTCISAWPSSAWPSARPCSPRRTRRIPSGFPRATRGPARRPPKCGSMLPSPAPSRRWRLLTKLDNRLSHSC
jgi:putative transposase